MGKLCGECINGYCITINRQYYKCTSNTHGYRWPWVILIVTEYFPSTFLLVVTRGEAIVLVKLSIILFSNSHNFTYYAHRFYLIILKIILGLMLMALQTTKNNILQTK